MSPRQRHCSDNGSLSKHLFENTQCRQYVHHRTYGVFSSPSFFVVSIDYLQFHRRLVARNSKRAGCTKQIMSLHSRFLTSEWRASSFLFRFLDQANLPVSTTPESGADEAPAIWMNTRQITGGHAESRFHQMSGGVNRVEPNAIYFIRSMVCSLFLGKISKSSRHRLFRVTIHSPHVFLTTHKLVFDTADLTVNTEGYSCSYKLRPRYRLLPIECSSPEFRLPG